MLQVILINRPQVGIKGFHIPGRKWQPLNLLYIATGLNNSTSQEIKAEIIDGRAMGYNVKQIKKILQEKKPIIVVIASEPYDFYICPNPAMDSFYELIKAAKELNIKYILSIGTSATIFDKELLNQTDIDYIVKGDDPITVVRLIKDLLAAKEKIKYDNVSFKKDKKLHLGEVHHLEDLDELPVGDYGLLPMEKYGSNMLQFPKNKFAIMTSGRGCSFQCKYCLKKLVTSRVRTMSMGRIKQELDVLVKKHKVKTIYFLDDLFTFDLQYTKKLCQLIIKENYNIAWGCQTRTDKINLDLLKIMKSAGCVYISYGVESGSQRVLKDCLKNLDLNLAAQNIKITQMLGIKTNVNMLYGFPNETPEEFNQTINFLIKNKINGMPTAIRFYPGCAYYNELIPHTTLKEMQKISFDLSLSKLTHRDVERGLAKLMLYKKIAYKEYGWSMFYFMLKYFFPNLTRKIRKIIPAKNAMK